MRIYGAFGGEGFVVFLPAVSISRFMIESRKPSTGRIEELALSVSERDHMISGLQ